MIAADDVKPNRSIHLTRMFADNWKQIELDSEKSNTKNKAEKNYIEINKIIALMN